MTFTRITVDPDQMGGLPCIRGLRIPGGFSDGASYALSLGLSNGDLFSHLVAYSPGFLRVADPIVGKPRVYVSHGTRDAVLPVTISRDGIVPSLRSGGYDVTYYEFEGAHEVPSAVSESALDWFLGEGGAG